jgi:hypothetical protein
MQTYIDQCPRCGATQVGLPPGVQTSTQRHCARGCSSYFTANAALAPEPERHETVRLFTPAPTQVPGQLAL